MWAWQTKCRVFRSWRRLVEQSKRQRELATLALQLQWEKRYETWETIFSRGRKGLHTHPVIFLEISHISS